MAGEATDCLLKLHGYQTLLPIGPSLDAYDWDWLASESPTPEELLIGEEISERDASIEAFVDIVVDIVSKQMGLTRRPAASTIPLTKMPKRSSVCYAPRTQKP